MSNLVRLRAVAASLGFSAPAVLGSIIVCVLALGVPSAIGATLTIDFDTPATGSDLIAGPLSTPFGEVSAENGEIGAFPPLDSSQWLGNDQFSHPGFARVRFDFDVSSITFDYTGFGPGSFLAEALDASGNVIDSLFDPSTAVVPDWVIGAILTGPGIRELRFQDTLSDQSGVDNLILNVPPAVVPEPSTLALLTLCLAGLGFSRRKKA